MKHGDIYRYRLGNTWARHSIAVVYDMGGALAACDTYWTGLDADLPAQYGETPVENLLPENYIGNREDFRKVHRDEYERYADADRLWIPVGGGSEAFYVKQDAAIDKAIAADYLRARVEDERSAIRSAEWKIRQLEKELAELAVNE